MLHDGRRLGKPACIVVAWQRMVTRGLCNHYDTSSVDLIVARSLSKEFSKLRGHALGEGLLCDVGSWPMGGQ